MANYRDYRNVRDEARNDPVQYGSERQPDDIDRRYRSSFRGDDYRNDGQYYPQRDPRGYVTDSRENQSGYGYQPEQDVRYPREQNQAYGRRPIYDDEQARSEGGRDERGRNRSDYEARHPGHVSDRIPLQEIEPPYDGPVPDYDYDERGKQGYINRGYERDDVTKDGAALAMSNDKEVPSKDDIERGNKPEDKARPSINNNDNRDSVLRRRRKIDHDQENAERLIAKGGTVRLRRMPFQVDEEEAEGDEEKIDLADPRRPWRSRMEMLKRRDQLRGVQTKKLTGYKHWKYNRAVEWQKTKRKVQEVLADFEVWRGSFKVIEGNFGASIVSYFRFVKLLFFLNFFITLVQLLVIVMPQEVFGPRRFTDSYQGFVANNSNHSLSRFHEVAVQCSLQYESFVENTTGTEASQRVIDFFQGTGWMENKILFFGYYFNKTIIFPMSQPVKLNYQMPLAFLFAVLTCCLVSLALLVHKSAKGLKESQSAEEEVFYGSFNKVFCGWDYNLSEEQGAHLKHKNIRQDFESTLSAQRSADEMKNMTQGQRACMYITRILVNLFVLAVIGASFYLIYYVQEQSAKLSADERVAMDQALSLLVQYLPSLTITILNIIVPFIFQKVVTLEKYSPDFEIRITIFRTVVLRLASLLFLLVSMRSVILNCRDGAQKVCGVCENAGFKCWETYAGQQIYKLVILNFIVTVLVTLLVEFPRSFIVTRFENGKVCQMVGRQEFDISKNVLDVIYTQTLCWLGAFFCPLIPAMTLVKMFIFFYLKQASLLVNCEPPKRAFRSSQSNSFFMLVLLASFVIVCIIPVGYSIGNIPPSQGCGAFRVYSVDNFKMYTVILDLVRSWPMPIPYIYFLIGSLAVLIPVAVLLILFIVYYAARISSSKKLAEILKERLALEGKDKQFLLKRVNEAIKA